MLDKIYNFIYNWAMGSKKEENSPPLLAYYVQDWE
jgi:hypothetical protein